MVDSYIWDHDINLKCVGTSSVLSLQTQIRQCQINDADAYEKTTCCTSWSKQLNIQEVTSYNV